MSFQDDAIEPLAVESAEHFAELLQHASRRGAVEPRELEHVRAMRPPRAEARRALPRELGN